MKNKKIVIGIAAFVLLLAVAVFAYNALINEYTPGDLPHDAAQEGENRQAAPDFTVFDKNGKEVTLSSFKGKPVVINFWATWCGPCKSELPAFQKMYNEYKDKIQFLMVNLTDGVQEKKADVDSFIEKEGYTFPVFYDTQYSGAYAYSVSSVPLTVFVDSEGYINNARIGAMNEAMLSRYINNLIGE